MEHHNKIAPPTTDGLLGDSTVERYPVTRHAASTPKSSLISGWFQQFWVVQPLVHVPVI
jgi:hypothetical protein